MKTKTWMVNVRLHRLARRTRFTDRLLKLPYRDVSQACKKHGQAANPSFSSSVFVTDPMARWLIATSKSATQYNERSLAVAAEKCVTCFATRPLGLIVVMALINPSASVVSLTFHFVAVTNAVSDCGGEETNETEEWGDKVGDSGSRPIGLNPRHRRASTLLLQLVQQL
jgi:hypothetical protein